MGLVSDSIGVTGEDTHEQLVDRTINAADNVLWTYKAHFEAADSFSNRSRRLDLGTTIGAALVTMALVWGEFPDFTIGVAILTAVISGYKTATEPRKKADSNYRAGEAYHKLFNLYCDFIALELQKDPPDVDALRCRYEKLEERRRELNDDMPNLHRKWYDNLDESIYEEIRTTESAKNHLMNCCGDSE